MADNENRQGTPSIGDILWEYADFVPEPRPETPVVHPPGSTLSSPQPKSMPDIPAPPEPQESQPPAEPEQPPEPEPSEPASRAEPAADPNAAAEAAELRQPEPEELQETEPEPNYEPEEDEGAEPRPRYEPEPDDEPEPRRIRFTAPGFRRNPLSAVVPPDASPREIAEEYREGLGALRLFAVSSAVVSFLLFFFTVASSGVLSPLAELFPFGSNILLHIGLLILSALLAMDVLDDGFRRLIALEPGASSVALLALVFTLLDAATLQMGSLRDYSLPFCLPCSLVLTAQMFGRYLERDAVCENAELASSVPRTYLVAQDYDLVGGKPAFRKWLGVPRGFGSQVRTRNSAQASYERIVPVLLGLCIVISLITTVAHHQPRLFLWAMSGSLIAAAGMGSALGYALPFSLVSRRLRRLGAVLAGWPGIVSARGGRNVLLTDFDLYPPDTVTVRKFQILGAFSTDQAASYTASLLRASGSGLSFPFDAVLRRENGTYFPVNNLAFPGNGISGEMQGRHILVGSSEFISQAGIGIPTGVRARDAVFCAVNNELAAVFYMNYTLHPTILPAMRTLFLHKLRPVFATRDFNIHPRKLRTRGAVPVEKLTYPDLQRRVLLSAPSQYHSSTLLAILTREGMAALSGVIAGAMRTDRIVRLNRVLVAVSSILGVLLVETLVSAASFTALSAINLALYLLLWLLPVILFSRWVPRF